MFKQIYIYISIYLLFIQRVFWSFWDDKISSGLRPDFATGSLSKDILGVFIYLLGFLWLIAVIRFMKWWFEILTAWWDDEKRNKWKKTLIFTIVWILVIIFAYAIVNWIIGWLDKM